MTTENTSSTLVSNLLPLVPASVRSLSSKPSWIGRLPPIRPATPGIPVMKQDVRISYSSKGLRAPVYLVSSLSEPQWEPVEMQFTALSDGELEFWSLFKVEEGEYQYKFRLGPGDWWALDENKPIVDDGNGNRNNTIKIDAPPAQTTAGPDSQAKQAAAPGESSPRPSFEQQPPPVPPKDTTTSVLNALKITVKDEERPAESPPTVRDSSPRPSSVGPSAPLTPPMTPDMNDKSASEVGAFEPFEIPELQRTASAASHYSDKAVEEGVVTPVGSRDENVVAAPTFPKEQAGGILAAFKVFILSLGSWLINILGGGARATGALAVMVGLAAVAYRIRDMKDEVIPTILSFLPSGKRNGTAGRGVV